jgi:hypothetical protein
VKIAFDVGGVLSKYPHIFKPLLLALRDAADVEVHVISDMHPKEKIGMMLLENGIDLRHSRVHSADYRTHGEMCKAILCHELGIDILIDDFPGYVASGNHVRLLVMPHPTEPYYHDDWKTDGSEGEFGRRVRPTKGDHLWA